MTRILKRPRAKADLAEIWDYIAEDSEDRADAFIDVIGKKLSMLAENSCLGKARHELGEGIRSFPVGRYILFYRAISEGIEVIRVLHGARDLNTIFDRDD